MYFQVQLQNKWAGTLFWWREYELLFSWLAPGKYNNRITQYYLYMYPVTWKICITYNTSFCNSFSAMLTCYHMIFKEEHQSKSWYLLIALTTCDDTGRFLLGCSREELVTGLLPHTSLGFSGKDKTTVREKKLKIISCLREVSLAIL